MKYKCKECGYIVEIEVGSEPAPTNCNECFIHRAKEIEMERVE